MRKMPRQTAPLVQPVDDRKVKHVPSKHTFTAGQKVGMWTFLTDTVRQKNWARCDCGTERHVWARNVSLGKSTSCGCADVGRIGRQSVTHGQSEHELYAVWVAMIARCHNTTDPRYPAYGGRGLVVCDAWRALNSCHIPNKLCYNLSLWKNDWSKLARPLRCLALQ